MQPMSQLELQVLLTQVATPNICPRKIHHAVAECFLIIPIRLADTFHVLHHRLEEMVTEKFIKRTQSGIDDMVEFELTSSYVIVSSNEGDDNISPLCEFTVSTVFSAEKCVLTSGLTAGL